MEAVGLNIQLNGEADFSRSIQNITQKSKELASELKLVSSAYGDNDKKMEVLGKQIQNQQELIGKLNDKYDSQKKHLDELGKELEQAKQTYGENSKEVQNLQKQYDKAEGELSKTKTSINKAETSLNEMNKALEDAQNETGGETNELDKMGDEMDETGKKAGSFGDKLKKGFAVAGKAIAAVGAAAGAAVGAIWKMGSDAAETADAVDKGSIRMGVSTDYFQKLGYAAGQSGVEMSDLEKAAKKLEGTGLNMEDAMAEIMALGTAEERATRAAELFGDNVAYTLSPLIEQSGEDFQALTDRAEELGLVMSEEDVKAGVVMGDTMADVKKSFKALGTTLGASVMPLITKLGEYIIKQMPKIQSMIDKLAPIITSLFENVVPVIMDLADQLLPVLSDLLAAILPGLSSFIQTIMPIITKLLSNLMPIITQIIGTLLPIFVDILNQILPVFMEFVNSLLPLISQFLDAALPLLSTIIETILPIFVGILEKIFPFIAQLAEMILPILTTLLNNLAPILMPILEVVGSIFEILGPFLDLVLAILQPIMNLIQKLLPPLMTLLQNVANIIKTILTPIVNGIKTAITKLKDGVSQFGTSFKNIWNSVKTFFGNIGNWFKDKIAQIGGFFSGLWDGIKSGAKAGLNGVIWFLNKAIDGLNAMLTPARKVIEVIGKVFGANWTMEQIAIPHIPMLANGGTLWNGTALVGEEGPELLTMMKNGGARVTPLNGSANALGTAGDTITLNIYGAEGQNVNNLADIVMDKIQQATNRKRAAYGY